jgi:hypothetical protein
VYDPATLRVAFDRVAGNRGANTPGIDGLTVADVEQRIGVPGLLDDLRASLKEGSFRPLPALWSDGRTTLLLRHENDRRPEPEATPNRSLQLTLRVGAALSYSR